MTVQQQVTIDEFWRMCGDGRRRELVRGEVIELPPASFEHGRVAANAVALLREFARARGLGTVVGAETGFILSTSPQTIRAADAAFVRQARLVGVDLSRFFPGPPDLAVEVVSPTDLAAEIEAKVQDYLAAGTPLIWIVYPATQHVVVHRPPGEARHFGPQDLLAAEPALPGFAVRVEELFT
jgi:Uma2 family endonuclease